MQSFFLSKPRIIHLEFRKLVAFNDESKHDSIEKQNSKIDKILVIVMHIMKDRFGFKDTIDYGNDSYTIFSFIHTETSNKTLNNEFSQFYEERFTKLVRFWT